MRLASATTLATLFLLGAPALAAPGDVVAEVESYQASFAVEVVAEGLDTPWSVAFLPDGRYLVSERPGNLRVVAADGTLSEPLAHGRTIAQGGQAGLFGVAIDPDFAANGMIYFIYAATDGELMWDEIAKGKLDGETLSDVEVIWSADSRTPMPVHFGGRLVFDGNGELFVTLGDRFANMLDAQVTTSHFGKVVHIKTDGTPGTGNPFTGGEDGLADVWSYGHRNQQGAFIHPETGELWTSEHGARGGDELNVVRAGANHGWPVVTYGINYDGKRISPDQEMEGMVDPVWYFQPSIGTSGLAYYNGDAFPRWKGDVFMGGLSGMRLVRLELNGERVLGQELLLSDLQSRIRDVQAGPDGFLYVLTEGPEGRLLRLTPKPEPETYTIP
jgi:glucose/arabinose dehydrogenase